MTTLHGQEIKVGDDVWTAEYGWIKVTYLRENHIYPICTNGWEYTINGLSNIYNIKPTLFWRQLEITAEALKKAITKLIRRN